jgi:hypothetical protein
MKIDRLRARRRRESRVEEKIPNRENRITLRLICCTKREIEFLSPVSTAADDDDHDDPLSSFDYLASSQKVLELESNRSPNKHTNKYEKFVFFGYFSSSSRLGKVLSKHTKRKLRNEKTIKRILQGVCHGKKDFLSRF